MKDGLIIFLLVLLGLMFLFYNDKMNAYRCRYDAGGIYSYGVCRIPLSGVE